MKANVRRQPLPKGAVAKLAVSRQVKCFQLVEVGGVSHRSEIEDLLGTRPLSEFAKRQVTALDQIPTRRQESIVVLPVDMLHYRGSAGMHTDPFEPEFPSEWTEQWLDPSYGVTHLGLNEWLDVATALTVPELNPFAVRGLVDVWCGALDLEREDGKKAYHLKLVSRHGRVKLEVGVEDKPPYLNIHGYVVFSIHQIG